ncbi:MAG: hydroxymethylglutaryl-CoA synthase [Gammaproteobacteria bacterium]|nr:hydroxymethylglutaryl-CoA synthase [Gammaproteobacteria bacterium]MDH5651331.1 hydroxymethylglutaryl-CoA synthase [Gammaproteobacteria bacterium]
MKRLLQPTRETGIVGYGAYIPRCRITAKEISTIWRGGRDIDNLPVDEISLPGPDEDVVTMSIEAAQNALLRAGISPDEIRAVYTGSESHPYAVKTTGTLIAEVLDIAPHTSAADLQFGCKAGSEALLAGVGLVGSGMADYAMALGVDSAQARPADELEYTAAAGAAALILGPATEAVAVLEGAYSYVTDTPDFFRRAYRKYPEHGNRFTGDPGYFKHIQASISTLMEEMQLRPEDISALVLHQPNERFPRKAAKTLGFSQTQLETGLLARKLGNTYSSSALLGLTAVLDSAKPGDRILMAGYGAGAGSDAFCFVVTDRILTMRDKAPDTHTYIYRTLPVDYLTYARLKGKINTGGE